MAKNLVEEVSEGNVIVLRPGREVEYPNGTFYAPASISLIKGNSSEHGKYCLVDCGGLGEGITVQDSLRRRKIFPKEVSQVLVTHNHPDHMANLHLFKSAEITTPDSRFDSKHPNMFQLMPPRFYQMPGQRYQEGLLLFGAELISTPGHSGWDYSVFRWGRNGSVAMVGDLFWSQGDFENDSEFMDLCVNPEMQKRSRNYVRTILKPTVIVPGHGKPFAPKY
tara:strand:- start:87 stop:752 length:666 start_codon:yes stop_codon:yes gene_type:complete